MVFKQPMCGYKVMHSVIDSLNIQYRPMNFHVRVQKVHWHGFKFHTAVSLFRKLPLPNAGVVSKKDVHKYLNTLPFSSYVSVWVRFFPCISTNTTHCNRWNAEAGMKIWLSSIKPNVKEICKNVKQFSQFFFV